MTGVWTCKACEERLALDTSGQALSSAPSNWCGAGRHVVRETVRYAPLGLGVQTPALANLEPLSPVEADASGQLGLFL